MRNRASLTRVTENTHAHFLPSVENTVFQELPLEAGSLKKVRTYTHHHHFQEVQSKEESLHDQS